MCIRDSAKDALIIAVAISTDNQYPVSYTHLDVYKRQIVNVAAPVAVASNFAEPDWDANTPVVKITVRDALRDAMAEELLSLIHI